ncbi:venom metalloproteinase antarease-like TtrivMP_A [Ornithodoros turicata]
MPNSAKMLLCLFLCMCVLDEFESRAVPLRQTIVYPKVVESREDGTGHTVSITEGLTLFLEKSPPVFSEEFLTRTIDHAGRTTDEYVQATTIEKNLFHDDNAVASIFLTQDTGVRMEGVIGHRLRIKPMEEAERSLEGHVAHILIEDQPQQVTPRTDYAQRMEELFSSEIKPGIRISSRNERTKIATPEVHLLLDSHFTAAMSYNKSRIQRYIAVFMNAVNIRYRTVPKPRIQLAIVGLTFVWNTRDEPYIVGSYIDSDLMFDQESLLLIDEHYRNHKEYIQADIFFTMTGRNLAFIISESFVSGLVMGYSFLGRACTTFKVGVAQDDPETYEALWVVTHEIAHLLGSTHDAEPAYELIPGNMGAEKCPSEQGYIMSYQNNHDENRHRFSPCSIEQLHNFISLNTSACLYEKHPHPQPPPPTNKFPGEGNFSLDEVCFASFGHMMPDVVQDKSQPLQDCVISCGAPGAPVDEALKLEIPDGFPCDADRVRDKMCVAGRCVWDPRKFGFSQAIKPRLN